MGRAFFERILTPKSGGDTVIEKLKEKNND